MADRIPFLSMPTLRELQEMLRWWRQESRRDIDEQKSRREFPYPARLFRTQADDPADENDATYPSQVDGEGRQLPGKFLKVIHDDAASDTVTVEVQEDERNWFCYSPYGWIPRLTDVVVQEISGLLVVTWVPILEVTTAAITAGSSGTVTMVNSGAANGQTFTAHLTHMSGSNNAASGDEAVVELWHKEKKWKIRNKECA